MEKNPKNKLSSLTPLQRIDFGKKQNIRLYVKREDLNHPLIQGNKLHKLRPNIEAAKAQGKTSIFSFGGAFSNHLFATAAAGKAYNIKTVGIVRGIAADYDNPTLSACRAFGMQLFKVEKKIYDAWAYRTTPNTNEDPIQEILKQYPNSYFLPTGGSNRLGVAGCKAFGAELRTQIEQEKNIGNTYICLGAGTGGTAAGIYLAYGKKADIYAFPPMKGSLEKAEILRLASLVDSDFSKKNAQHLHVVSDYGFRGYGRLSDALRAFCDTFEQKTGIRPDPIYTVKLFYGVLDMMEQDFFPKNSTIVMLHTGGLQGWNGFD